MATESVTSPDIAGSPPDTEQQAAGVGILLQIMMLVLAFVLGHVFRRKKIYVIPEASASLLIGLIVGVLANISDTKTSIRAWFNFHEEFFFLFLLPPIIFHSGFSLSPKPFFSNFGAIVTFAIFGTFLASIITGILVYLGGLIYFMYRLPFVECLMFGALISATDPVTVLSIFQELGTDVNLYALVFGESVLNDAMAISLYRTMSMVKTHPTGLNILMVVVRFLETFVGSMSAGVVVGFISALLFKYAGLHIDNLQNLESCLFVLFPYFSYMLAEGLGLSGIVSILFTGIVMKHYTYSNLSKISQRFVPSFFHLISSLAETFVFIYMGFDIAMRRHSWSHAGFIFFSIIFIVVARAVIVLSCSYLVNLVRPAHRQIPRKHQKALWYSGLRGAMAFALALQSVHDLPEGHGQTIFTATTAIIVLTVLLIGGSTSTMLEALEVVGDSHNIDSTLSSLGTIPNVEEGDGYVYVSHSDEEESSSSGNKIKMKLKKFHRSASSFTTLDKYYLTPFFTSQNGDEEEESRIPCSNNSNSRSGLENQEEISAHKSDVSESEIQGGSTNGKGYKRKLSGKKLNSLKIPSIIDHPHISSSKEWLPAGGIESSGSAAAPKFVIEAGEYSLSSSKLVSSFTQVGEATQSPMIELHQERKANEG